MELQHFNCQSVSLPPKVDLIPVFYAVEEYRLQLAGTYTNVVLL